ncbi:kinetochore protein Spc24 [Diretmus argenteus]
MAQANNFQALEDMAEELVNVINSTEIENQLRQVGEEHQGFCKRHVETKKIVTHILKDIAQTEEGVGQMLMDMEEQRNQGEMEIRSLEEQLRQYTAKSQITDSELQFLQRELESLRNTEQELQNLQQEVDEDTTEVIPSAIYIAQLYHKITKIKWEHDTEPHILKGVHYGADLATPINIDTSVRSQSEVSDQLWGFVSTEW